MYKKALNCKHFFHSAIVIALVSISACATSGGQNTSGPELDLTKYSTITSHDAVNNVDSSYQTSDINQLAIFAPDHYSTAGKAIEDAKTLLAESQPREQVVQKVAVAEAVLRNGDLVMRKVKDILKNEITIKEKLDSLNTKSAYGNEYGSLDERLNKLIKKIESGNNTDDQNRETLLKDMRQLERKALHYNAMNEPLEILKRVKNHGGEQLAPVTYAEALVVFKHAEEFIQQNPNYDIGIAKIGREALFAAKRALYVTEGVSVLKQKVIFAPEQVVLDEEYRMYRVSRQLAELDYRDNSLEVQSELLAKEAESIALELKNKDGLVIALRDTLIKVRDSSSRLTMLSESTEQLKKEKNDWLAKEALFNAKITQLTEDLKKSDTQLDFTQQKLLTIQSNNTQLTKQILADKENAIVLANELPQKKDTTPTQPAKKVVAGETEEKPPTIEKNTQPEVAVQKTLPTKNIETEKINDRPKITEQETLDALKSAKELISSLKATEDKLLGPDIIEKKTAQPDSFFNEDSNSFVDATE
ncbi:MAG: DASH complex subunit DAD3 family protein [Gammaproteobacteria bacterium]|nr:DASH complex subunit DAD3 family protein [Gammaproteobacteria bacterium]